MTRVSVIIHGLVQGVAFRHHTRQRALDLGVCGLVRNQPDGAVEGIFEGSDEAVASLVEWCRNGPPAARVERLDISRGNYSGTFDTFSVTF
ncbi:MAG: acylphosphatase [Geobacteraceae bacterium]|nr:acylphosphatase [Geobacteraceae bacterium]